MKIPSRTFNIIIVVAFISFTLLLGLRVAAQSDALQSQVTLTIKGYRAELNDKYKNFDEFDKLLQSKSKDFYLDHDGQVHTPKKSETSLRPHDLTTSEIIKVSARPTPSPTSSLAPTTGTNVTQQITTRNTSDMAAVLAAFK